MMRPILVTPPVDPPRAHLPQSLDERQARWQSATKSGRPRGGRLLGRSRNKGGAHRAGEQARVMHK